MPVLMQSFRLAWEKQLRRFCASAKFCFVQIRANRPLSKSLESVDSACKAAAREVPFLRENIFF
jgi:hypothetical protein